MNNTRKTFGNSDMPTNPDKIRMQNEAVKQARKLQAELDNKKKEDKKTMARNFFPWKQVARISHVIAVDTDMELLEAPMAAMTLDQPKKTPATHTADKRNVYVGISTVEAALLQCLTIIMSPMFNTSRTISIIKMPDINGNLPYISVPALVEHVEAIKIWLVTNKNSLFKKIIKNLTAEETAQFNALTGVEIVTIIANAKKYKNGVAVPAFKLDDDVITHAYTRNSEVATSEHADQTGFQTASAAVLETRKIVKVKRVHA